MIVCWKEVEGMFHKLIEETITREEVHDWAFVAMHKVDAGLLKYKPKTDEKKYGEQLNFF